MGFVCHPLLAPLLEAVSRPAPSPVRGDIYVEMIAFSVFPAPSERHIPDIQWSFALLTATHPRARRVHFNSNLVVITWCITPRIVAIFGWPGFLAMGLGMMTSTFMS